MPDYGIKIAKPSQNTDSVIRQNYAFWSKYQSLPFMFKVSQTINVDGGGCTGTQIYTHSLGFKPLVLGFVLSKISAARESIPLVLSDAGNKLWCNGDHLSENFSLNIKDNTVEIVYDVNCFIPMFGSRCIDFAAVYTVDLYFFMFELGRV